MGRIRLVMEEREARVWRVWELGAGSGVGSARMVEEVQVADEMVD